ncbi:MAG: AsmA-like C-terminal region-containing protein [Candidatus Eisenbacteria bacterium]|uniref:AsmA-like C-terminal region-containing protein n=1 Tax=Eiseniibacteriota bacterium TaxID=2212470 RepID=A0A948RRQ2_UNCEI|nr:AsmA-like C-terminal region-containing protein [Candidatus Eisenbacteria bacterium]MBU1949105.1 AsmA-like C-terminal region-containing protein [Candidatus Eisenbacteria bacterium]MBU2689765.1 AsmA-like C-terminal region-containing protein [Candidatus Eisenbacteria bacterium]
MKKTLIVIAALLLLLVAALFIVPLVFEGQIKEMVKHEANKRMAAALDFDDIGLSLIRHFPKATLTIDKMIIVNKEPFAGDTLLVLPEFEGTVNLGSLIGGGPLEIVSIHLIEPHMNLRVGQDGRNNWQIFAESPPEDVSAVDASTKPFNLAVQTYEIKDGHLSYQDEAGGVQVLVAGLRHQGHGDFSQSQFLLATHTEIAAMTVLMQGTTYLSEAQVVAKADINVDLVNKKYVFADNEIRLNDLALAFTGWAAQRGEEVELDLRLGAPEADLKSLLSMIPFVYQKDFEDLSAEGQLKLAGEIKGVSSKTSLPNFDISVNLNEGRAKYSQMPTSIDQVQMTLQISNRGKEPDDVVVKLDSLHFEILGKAVDITGSVKTPLSDPLLDLNIIGSVDLGTAVNIAPLEQVPDLKGDLRSELHLKGNLSDAEKGHADKFSVSGVLVFTDVDYGSAQLPERLKVSNAQITFSPQRITLDKLIAKVGKSDVSANGLLEDVVGYIFAKKTLKGTLVVKSSFLDLNPWVTDESEKLQAVELPAGVEILMQADFGRVLYDNLELADAAGNLQLKDQILSLLDLHTKTLGGTVVASGNYSFIPPKRPHLFLDAKVTELSIPTTFEKLEAVQRFAPIAHHLVGSFSGEINIDSDLDAALLPMWQEFFSKGQLRIPKVDLKGFAPLDMVADNLQLAKLKNPSMHNLDPAYLIEGGRFRLKPIDFSIDNYLITVSGSNGLDKSIDYKLTIHVPASELKSKTNSFISQLVGQDIAALTNETIVIDVAIGGTLTSPSVKTSLAQIIKGAVTDPLKDAVTAEVDKQKLEAEKKAQEEIAKQKLELEKKKKEAEEKIKNKLKDLFKKP